jgi:hypothetical protein
MDDLKISHIDNRGHPIAGRSIQERGTTDKDAWKST